MLIEQKNKCQLVFPNYQVFISYIAHVEIYILHCIMIFITWPTSNMQISAYVSIEPVACIASPAGWEQMSTERSHLQGLSLQPSCQPHRAGLPKTTSPVNNLVITKKLQNKNNSHNINVCNCPSFIYSKYCCGARHTRMLLSHCIHINTYIHSYIPVTCLLLRQPSWVNQFLTH